MEAERHTLETKRTAQLYTLGEAGPHIRDLWVVLHGIGQQAAYFIKHFELLVDDTTMVVAPEGLSRYYLNGKYERVGASWMTKLARLEEIDDQIHYLDKVMVMMREALPQEELRIRLLGFSQGVATAWRWMMQGETAPDSFVLWAGKNPEEYNDTLRLRMDHIPFYGVAGTNDPFIKAGYLDMYYKKLSSEFPQLQTKTFEGGHNIHPEPLREIKVELAEKKIS